MSMNDSGSELSPESDQLHLVCGSGGSRAILGGAGAILACHHAGIKQWHTIGGASGGSIPGVMLASGMNPSEIVRQVVEIDFTRLVTRQSNFLKMFLSYLLSSRRRMSRPRFGMMRSEKMGTFIDGKVAEWPKNFWTTAVVGDKQWVFTAEGIFEYAFDQTGEAKATTVSSTPGPVGLAIRATCAVPGVISPVKCHGNYLFDGGLSVDGRCPVGVVKRHFKARPDRIVGFDVGADQNRKSRRIGRIWRAICRDCVVDPNKQIVDFNGVILIKAPIQHIRSLEFNLTRDQKWEAVMAGFGGTVLELGRVGLLSGDRFEQATEIVRLFEESKRTRPAAGGLSASAERLLSEHGLY